MKKIIPIIAILVLLTFGSGCAIKTQVLITTEIDGPGLPKPAGEYTVRVFYGITGKDWPPEYGFLFGKNMEMRRKELNYRARSLGIFKNMKMKRIWVSGTWMNDFGPADLNLVVTQKYETGPATWRYIQAIDLFAHTLIFPTLPYIRSSEFTIYIYDSAGLEKDRKSSCYESYLKKYTATGRWKYFVNAWVALYAGIDDTLNFLGYYTWMRQAYDLENERKVEEACFELMRKDLRGK